LITIEGLLVFAGTESTLVYVPERRLPTTGKSPIWILIDVGGILSKEICAAVVLANAGAVVVKRTERAAAATACGKALADGDDTGGVAVVVGFHGC
jgi:hypothetical protein